MNEDNDSLNVGDSVYVHWASIDGMFGDGIYGFGTITSVLRGDFKKDLLVIWFR